MDNRDQEKEKERRERKEAKHKEEDEEVTEELKQTFPASDPLSVVQPGHEQEKDEE